MRRTDAKRSETRRYSHGRTKRYSLGRRRYSRRSKTRYRRKTRRRRRTLLLLAGFLFMFMISCGLYYKAYVSTDVYQDSDGFTAYADAEFESRQLLNEAGAVKTEYHFGTPTSYALHYDICDNEEISAFRDKQIEYMKTAFNETKAVEEAEREEKYGSRIGYKPLTHALLISSRVYESQNGVISVVIYESSSTEKDKTMHEESSGIHTYQFSAGTGQKLIPLQIFETDYRQKCSEFFTSYFDDNYNKRELAEDWESYLTSADTNFNEFAVTERGVTFFFDEGTVLKKSEGPVYVGMTMEELGENLKSEVLERYIDPYMPMVAITYDDGPGGKAEKRILDCLAANDAVATFFYQGYRIEGSEDKVQRAYRMGCELGNHTWNHPVLTKLSRKNARKQFVNTNQAVYKACGAYPTVFRPSYGITNKTINKMSGMPVIMWTIDPEDWSSRNAKKVFRHITEQEELDGSIILLHSIYDSTAKATEMLIPWLKENGYQLVTVSELIKYKEGKAPKAGKVYE